MDVIELNVGKGFRKLAFLVSRKSPLQRKALESFLQDRDDLFWSRAESFSAGILTLCEGTGITLEYIADSYLRMCHDMLTEQIKFKKTGCYSCKSAADAKRKVYSSEKEMTSYMYGLALSQFLWPNHYAMFDFFITESNKVRGVESYLEIGPGHGLYLLEALKIFKGARFLAMDISPVSTKIARNIIGHCMPEAECDFVVKDVNSLKNMKFDYIVMCEVLEHLDDPLAALRKVCALLEKGDRFFVTTCVNCPAIDHVYLYRNVEEIRGQFRESGFEIVEDLPLPVDQSPAGEVSCTEGGVNYAAMLRKK